jgi:Ca-activated chloride channel homolog
MLFVVMLRRLSVSFLTLAVSVAGLAQPSSPVQHSIAPASSIVQPATVIAPPTVSETVSVGYVMIPFTVLGEKNRPLTDLRNSEVSLLIDGTPVRSDMFEKSENAPVSFTILIDGSGSMALAGKMDSARAAIGALLAHRHPGDDFSLWLFSDSAARELVPFTTQPADVTNALATIKPYGKTAFFDALASMPERSREGANPTRAIILLSDGIDNASHLKRADLPALLEGVATPIYPLGLRDPNEEGLAGRTREELSDVDLLREVAELTGGKLTLGSRPQELALAVAGLENDLRAQYLIGFSPTGKGTVKYRKITLKLAGRVRSVRVRAGYRGTEPPVLTAATREKPKRERKGS